ncbi:MAG: type IV toxin-antitoxin system AbiEi family antitoxin domain-containing protein [Candidatus Nanopelagicales bacterium]
MSSPARASKLPNAQADWVATITALAAGNGGFLVAEDVAAAGIDQAWLSKLAARGRLERRAQGVYWMAGWPTSRLDEFRQATLWARRRGVIAGEAALDLWDLSHVVPRVIDLIVQPGYRPRKAGGDAYRVRSRALPAESIDQVDGIPVLSAFATIQDCISGGTGSREIAKAIDTAQARELINRRLAARLLVQLDGREGM